MARALVSFYYIMDQLGSIISSEFTLFADVEEEIQKLESKFHSIQTVLNDEEKRFVKEEGSCGGLVQKTYPMRLTTCWMSQRVLLASN